MPRLRLDLQRQNAASLPAQHPHHLSGNSDAGQHNENYE
jgi:hypothetical protein